MIKNYIFFSLNLFIFLISIGVLFNAGVYLKDWIRIILVYLSGASLYYVFTTGNKIFSIKGRSFLEFINKERNFKFLLIGFAFLFFVIFSLIKIFIHKNFITTWDLGWYVNALWHITTKFDFKTSFWLHSDALLHYLGSHFEPIILIFAPIFYFFKSPYVLLIGEVFVIVLGAIPLYLILKKFRFSNKNIFLIFLIYFLFPGVLGAVAFDFHPSAFMPTLFLSLFYFYFSKKELLFYLIAFLIILTKETLIIYLVFFGIFLIFKYKDFKNGTIVTILGLLSYYIIIYKLIPYFGKTNYVFFEVYEHLGKSLPEVLKNLFFHPIALLKNNFLVQKIPVFLFYIGIFLPAILFNFSFILFLPLFFSRYFINYYLYPGPFELNWYQYNIEYLAFGIVALILFLEKFKKYGERIIKIIFIIILIFNFYYFYIPYYNNFTKISKRTPEIKELVKLIPKDINIKISVPTRLVPHFAMRNFVDDFPKIGDAQYIIAEKEYIRYIPKTYAKIVEFFKNSGYYLKIKENDYGIVFKRIKDFNGFLKEKIYFLCKEMTKEARSSKYSNSCYRIYQL